MNIPTPTLPYPPKVGPNDEGPLPWIERDYTPVSSAKEWEVGRCEILIKVYPQGRGLYNTRHFGTNTQKDTRTSTFYMSGLKLKVFSTTYNLSLWNQILKK